MSENERLIIALESIARSLKIIAEKPVPGITLEVTPDLMTAQEAMEALK